MTRTKKKQPTKSQRKVAAAPTLRQTLSDATTATRGKRLIELAVRSADRYSPKRQNWFDRFSESKPRLAAEMLELVHDWLAGGPTRKALPRIYQLHAFCRDDCGVDVTVCTFKRWVLEQKP